MQKITLANRLALTYNIAKLKCSHFSNAKFYDAVKKLGNLFKREITKLENRIKYIVFRKARDSRRKNILTKLKFPQHNESDIEIFTNTDTPIRPIIQ